MAKTDMVVRQIGDNCPHLAVNPQVAQSDGRAAEDFVEFSHLGTLANRQTIVECISRDIVRSRRESQPAPKYTKKSLKAAIKVHLRAWGLVGVLQWRQDVSEEDQKEVASQADKTLFATLPDLYEHVADAPTLPPEDLADMKAVSSTGLTVPGTESTEVSKTPADLDVSDLKEMNRDDMRLELRSRGFDVPDNVSKSKATKLLTEDIKKTTVTA